jgi:hypothetical protein
MDDPKQAAELREAEEAAQRHIRPATEGGGK